MNKEDNEILKQLSSLYEEKIADEKSAISSTLLTESKDEIMGYVLLKRERTPRPYKAKQGDKYFVYMGSRANYKKYDWKSERDIEEVLESVKEDSDPYCVSVQEARTDKEFAKKAIFNTIDYWYDKMPRTHTGKLHLGMSAKDFVEGMKKTGQEGKSDAQTYGAVIMKYVDKIQLSPFYLKVTIQGKEYMHDIKKRGKLPVPTITESSEDITEEVDVFFCEDTEQHYYIELNEETLEERRIHIRINSKGQRIKKIKCPPGRVVKTVNGRRTCVTPSGREKLKKKLAIKRSVRTKKAKGGGARKRANFKRQKALRKRRQMGLK